MPEKYTSFTFIKAPEDAAAFLKRYGDPNANAALTMVMNQADGSEASQATSAGENIVENSSGRMVDAETGVPVGENAVEKPSSRLVDAETGVPVQKSKADFKTETSKKDDIENPKYKHHDEADIKTKTSTDSSVPEVGVTCCCGFW